MAQARQSAKCIIVIGTVRRPAGVREVITEVAQSETNIVYCLSVRHCTVLDKKHLI